MKAGLSDVFTQARSAQACSSDRTLLMWIVSFGDASRDHRSAHPAAGHGGAMMALVTVTQWRGR
jgi:hypothetical protein